MTEKCEIDRNAFAQAVLRHMVEISTGEISDEQYDKAVRAAAAANGIEARDGSIRVQGRSAGYLSYLSSLIADAYFKDSAPDQPRGTEP